MSDLKITTVPRNLYYHEVEYVRGLESEITRLRALNAELVAALYDIASNEYSGYGGIGGVARAAIASAKGEPKLEPQSYKVQPPTFVPKG